MVKFVSITHTQWT